MTSLLEDTRLLLSSIADYTSDLVNPTLRLGVTGLSRSGKTVFITALVHGLLNGARWPLFEAAAQGRITRVRLVEQPDPTVPRFPVESHVTTLSGPERSWPEGTRQVSEIRLVIDYATQTGLWRGGSRSLTLDIVDYPGEWLLDLPLLDMGYAEWSARTLAASRKEPRLSLAGPWLAALAQTRPESPASETEAYALSRLFTDYLRACRDDRVSLSTLPPGRFLMPGDMEGSPALTFCPLPVEVDMPSGSLGSLMQRRYEAYKDHVIRPFFRNHFARLDRQIVLVDALSAINAGSEALADLELAMADILQSFRPGQNSWLSSILARRIDKVLFAATKADHLHHLSHDRMEAILARLAGRAIQRSSFAGAKVDVIALAALRATRETQVKQGRDMLDCIVGQPIKGETIDGKAFDGETEAAIFPGDLPEDPESLFSPQNKPPPGSWRFVRFRPPLASLHKGQPQWPQIRMDRAVQFLIGDRLA